MSTNIHYLSHVRQASETMIVNLSQFPDDMLSIKFKLYKCETTWNISDSDQDQDDDVYQVLQEQQIQLETEELIFVDQSELSSDDHRHRTSYKTLMIAALSSMEVPEIEHPSIIWKIFRVIKSALPRVPILVDIYDVTCASDDDQNDEIYEVTRESLETYHDLPIPATKSSIENLEKVRVFDDLEATRNKSCVICMEGFDDHRQVLRLPCLHIYHGDCIVQWLETSHLCPLCRYKMPHEL